MEPENEIHSLPLSKQHNSANQAQPPRKKRAVLEDLSNVLSMSSGAKDTKEGKVVTITTSSSEPPETLRKPDSEIACVGQQKSVLAEHTQKTVEKTETSAPAEVQKPVKSEIVETLKEKDTNAADADLEKTCDENKKKDAIVSSSSALNLKNDDNSVLDKKEKLENIPANDVVEPKPDALSSLKSPESLIPPVDKEPNLQVSLKRTSSDADTESATPEAERSVKRTRTAPDWDDLDAEEADDPLMVVEYSEDIFNYLYELEDRYIPNPDYMSDQRELDWPQRALLIDWIIEVHQKLHLLPETLFLCVNIIDRFMTLRVVGLDKIQLVGVTALLIAAKYEEVFPPVLSHFVYLTSGNFNDEDLISAEKFMLQVLEYEMSFPNPLNFLRRISKADEYQVQSRAIAKYFLELCMLDHEMLGYPPSLHAAAAMYLSRCVLGLQPFRPSAEFERQQQQRAEKEEEERRMPSNSEASPASLLLETPSHWEAGWNRNLVHYSGGFTYREILPLVRRIIRFLSSGGGYDSEAEQPSDALFQKYCHKKYYKAATIVEAWLEHQRSAIGQNSSSRTANGGRGTNSSRSRQE